MRDLVPLTGETLTDAVKVVLGERLAQERAHHAAKADLPARLIALSEGLRQSYDTRPVSRHEWDVASGDE